jgi:hypothetical protein
MENAAAGLKPLKRLIAGRIRLLQGLQNAAVTSRR